MASSKANQVYELIQSKAGSNQFMQGLSGVLGFPFTLIVDGSVIFTHYGPMLNAIRTIYGRNRVTSDIIGPIIKGSSSEIFADLVLDKIIGQVPLIGIASNVMCAKTMTWRLGLLFAMLSSRGEEINTQSVSKTMKLIRTLFPQRNMFLFKAPTITNVEKLLNAVEGATIEDFESRVDRLLDTI